MTFVIATSDDDFITTSIIIAKGQPFIQPVAQIARAMDMLTRGLWRGPWRLCPVESVLAADFSVAVFARSVPYCGGLRLSPSGALLLSAAGPAHTAGLRVVALAAATLSVVPCFSFLGIHICPLVQSRSFHFDAFDSLIPPLSMLSCLGATGPLASNPLALASVTGNGEDIDFESSSGYLVGSLSSWAPGPLTVLSVAAAVALSSATPPIFLLLCCLAWLGFSNQQSFLVSRWNYSPLRWLLLSCLGCGFLPSPCAAMVVVVVVAVVAWWW